MSIQQRISAETSLLYLVLALRNMIAGQYKTWRPATFYTSAINVSVHKFMPLRHNRVPCSYFPRKVRVYTKTVDLQLRLQ
jgi:hypothetical protein